MHPEKGLPSPWGYCTCHNYGGPISMPIIMCGFVCSLGTCVKRFLTPKFFWALDLKSFWNALNNFYRRLILPRFCRKVCICVYYQFFAYRCLKERDFDLNAFNHGRSIGIAILRGSELLIGSKWVYPHISCVGCSYWELMWRCYLRPLRPSKPPSTRLLFKHYQGINVRHFLPIVIRP